MTVTDCLIGRFAMTANAATGIMELTKTTKDAEVSYEVPTETLAELATIAGVCNDAEFDVTTTNLPLEQRRLLGDATDQAVLRFAEGIYSVSDMRYEWRSIFKLPFNSKNKFMLNVVQPAHTGLTDKMPEIRDPLVEMTLLAEGAPDILLPRCTHFLNHEGRTERFMDEHCKFVEQTKDLWSRESKRVILMARKILPGEMATLSPDTVEYENEVLSQTSSALELVGLVAMIDPPREEIPEVVRILRGAGIKVHMVTGNFKLTAQAIAVQCGIHHPATWSGPRCRCSDKHKHSPIPIEYGRAQIGRFLHKPELLKIHRPKWT